MADSRSRPSQHTSRSAGRGNPGDSEPRGNHPPASRELRLTSAPTPWSALARFLKINPKAGAVLLGGLAVIAVAAIAVTWQVDVKSAGLMGSYIAGLGVLLYLLTIIVTDAIIKRVMAWFVSLLIMAVILVFFVSAVFPGRTVIAPAACLVRFWERCEAVGDEIAERNYTPPPEVKSSIPPGRNQISFSQYRVSMHFAGTIRRQDAIATTTKLSNMGWQVVRPDRGGERTTNAVGLNEVRYSDLRDDEAAKALARLVQESRLVTQEITTKQVSSQLPRTLEVWVSR